MVTASLSRRELRERLEASSVAPMVDQAAPAPGAESRRSRRERELAESAALTGESGPLTDRSVVASSVASARRGRAHRDVSGLQHLLRAPVDVVPTPATGVAEPTAPAEVAEPMLVRPAVSDPPVAAEPVRTITFSHDDDSRPVAAVSAPRGARSSVSTPVPQRRVLPRMRRAGGSSSPRSRKRTLVNSVVMIATAGLVATIALPAYAYSEPDSLSNARLAASSELGIQSLTVAGVNAQNSTRDGYTTTGDMAAMDSTTGTTVSPTVQALAAELVADVASGKLVGSVPDHIAEIRNLANGVAVPGCGVDYRVLQTIKVAVDNFDKVGVSDINRLCTGQIEGAGTQSSHYKDGGGHAVDFYILNGHGLTGADSDSLKLIRLLDPLVPKGSGLGQAECRPSIALTNFAAFDDTCTHVHVDFGGAQGVSLNS